MGADRILLVEDDKEIREGVEIFLRSQGYQVFQAADGLEGLKLLEQEEVQLAIVDVMMPRMDGITMVVKLREMYDFPVIFLSAKSEEVDKILGLNMGADDYITKPFNAGELLARIRVALRHRSSAPRQEPVFELDTLKLDFEKRKVSVRGEEVHLTPIEYKMLSLLVNNSGKVLTHHYIQQEVWGYDTTDDYQSLRVFMANIRRKIEEDSTKPRFILTEVGVGYRFVES